MRAHISRKTCLVVTVLSIPLVGARAQQIEQTISLEAGWNAVYLTVDPSPAAADALFAGLPVGAVWTISDGRRTVIPPQCRDGDDPNDPSCVPSTESGWRFWLPPQNPAAVINTLRYLRGGHVYLIRAREPAELKLVGKPDSSKTRWSKGLNLVGFHVTSDPSAAPTFAEYLSGSAAHENAEVYEVKSDGKLEQVTEPAKTRITPGRGYWVSADRAVVYDGPIEIDEQTLRGIRFGGGGAEHAVRFRNLAKSQRRVGITLVSTSGASSPPSADSAGRGPLRWLDSSGDGREGAIRWRSLDRHTWAMSAAGTEGAEKVLRVAASGSASSRVAGEPGGTGGTIEGMLIIEDDGGYQRLIPFGITIEDRTGLWAGQVTVDAVDWISTSTLQPSSSEFDFRILIHNDGTAVHLLTEATMMWDATLDAGTGGYVLVVPTDDTGVRPCGALHASEDEEADTSQLVSPRISTAAFSFRGALPLAVGSADISDFGTNGMTLKPAAPGNGLIVESGDPLNPFYHRYHPDHGCAQLCVGGDREGEPCTHDGHCVDTDGHGSCEWIGGGCARITRKFVLTFDVADAGDPAWGSTLLGGTYTETIEGLHKDPINVKGRFDLRRVSRITDICKRSQQ